MNIVLIGMRGSGKSTIAHLLSQKLQIPCIEMDESLVKKIGMAIPEFVEERGWEKFRDVEAEITERLSKKDNVILSTGGGVILRKTNVDNLKQNGKLFYLKAHLETLILRMGNDPNRPFLTNQKTRKEEIEQVLRERTLLYKNAADVIIETDNLTIDQTIHEIIEKMI